MTQKDRKKLAAAALALATSTANDVVKLALMAAEGAAQVEGLDLTMLETFERSPTGGVKVKILDRVEALRAALDCLATVDDNGEAAAFLEALGGVVNEN